MCNYTVSEWRRRFPKELYGFEQEIYQEVARILEVWRLDTPVLTPVGAACLPQFLDQISERMMNMVFSNSPKCCCRRESENVA